MKNLIVGFIVIALTIMTNIHACGAEPIALGAPLVPTPQYLGKLPTRLFQGLHSVDIAKCYGDEEPQTFVDKFFEQLGRTVDAPTLQQLLASRALLLLQSVVIHENNDEDLQKLTKDCLVSFMEVLKEANIKLDEILPKELNELLTAKIPEKPVEIQSNFSKSGQRKAKRKLRNEAKTQEPKLSTEELFSSLFQKLQQMSEVGRDVRWSIEYLLGETEVLWLNRVTKTFWNSYYLRWLSLMARLEIIGAAKDTHFILTAQQAYNVAYNLRYQHLIQETLNYFIAKYTQQRQEDLETMLGEVQRVGIKPERGGQDMYFYSALVGRTKPQQLPPRYKIPQIKVSPPPYNLHGFGAIGEKLNVRVGCISSAVTNPDTKYNSALSCDLWQCSTLRPDAKPFQVKGNNRNAAPPPYSGHTWGEPPAYQRDWQ